MYVIPQEFKISEKFNKTKQQHKKISSIHKKEETMNETNNANIDVFQDNLSELINKADKNLDVIAQKTGISKTSLSYYQNGLRMPKREHLEKLALYFDTTVDYLLGRDIATTKIDQKILEQLGLSPKAINRLREVVSLNKKNLPFEFHLKMINSLIENMFDTNLLNNLYKYVYGDFGFIENLTSNEIKSLTFVKALCKDEMTTFSISDTDLQELFYSKVQKDIIKYRELVEHKASLKPKTRKRGSRKAGKEKQ